MRFLKSKYEPATQMNSPIKRIDWQNDTAIVYAEGEIDLHISPQFQTDLKKVIEQKPAKMVVNLSQVPYMDSSGVAALVKLLSKTRSENIKLVIENPSSKVMSIFEITKLTSVFDIKSDSNTN